MLLAGSLEAELPRYRQATSLVHYTTMCNTQSSAPEDGRDQRPKHVELIGIINKPLLLHLLGVYINDARSNKYQIWWIFLLCWVIHYVVSIIQENFTWNVFQILGMTFACWICPMSLHRKCNQNPLSTFTTLCSQSSTMSYCWGSRFIHCLVTANSSLFCAELNRCASLHFYLRIEISSFSSHVEWLTSWVKYAKIWCWM